MRSATPMKVKPRCFLYVSFHFMLLFPRLFNIRYSTCRSVYRILPSGSGTISAIQSRELATLSEHQNFDSKAIKRDDSLDLLDRFINSQSLKVFNNSSNNDRNAIKHSLYEQYKSNDEVILPDILPYEPYPKTQRRADYLPSDKTKTKTMIDYPQSDKTKTRTKNDEIHKHDGDRTMIGDGIVLIVHSSINEEGVGKNVVCSGFVVKTENGKRYIVSCAHTLEEVW